MLATCQLVSSAVPQSQLTLRRRQNVTLLRTLGSRRLRQLRPKGAALGLNEGYHVETARSGGPITPKRCDFRGVRFRSITWVTAPIINAWILHVSRPGAWAS